MPAPIVWFTILLAGLAGIGCGQPATAPAAAEPEGRDAMLDPVAVDYVKLVLALGEHDAAYVDAYYGPDEWRAEVRAQLPGLAEIRRRALEQSARIERIGAEPLAGDEDDELVALRQRYLATQLRTLAARADMLSGTKLSFDDESKALYDAVAPTYSEQHFQHLRADLEPLLPGRGPLADRYEAYKKGFVIPPDRLDRVFRLAIDGCRARTLAHIELPETESFTVEYVTGKSWSAYNWYQGNFQSRIEVNTDLPIYIDRAIDLACHEGYPGHHVYNALLEQHLVRDRGWVEFSVYPLFSPQSLIAEGTANYGIELAFPGDERVVFERDVLFPAAGLDPATAEQYYRIEEQVEQLAYAGNEAARRYLNGTIDAAEAARLLREYALMPRARAEQRVRFFDDYRSYVINYNLGKDLVRRYIESRGGTAAAPLVRWEEFERLLSSPRLPSGLG